MKTIIVEVENGLMVVKCVECGWVLATARPWKGLDDDPAIGHGVHCRAKPDKEEISEAHMDFKKTVLSEAWSQDLAKELIGIVSDDSSTHWRAHCEKCNFEIGDTTCKPSEIASMIINEQLRNNCSCKGGFHKLILSDYQRGKEITIKGAHVSPPKGGD
jgi:hypothetical protein